MNEINFHKNVYRGHFSINYCHLTKYSGKKQASIVLPLTVTILYKQNKNFNCPSNKNLLSMCNVSLGVGNHTNFKDKMKRKLLYITVVN